MIIYICKSEEIVECTYWESSKLCTLLVFQPLWLPGCSFCLIHSVKNHIEMRDGDKADESFEAQLKKGIKTDVHLLCFYRLFSVSLFVRRLPPFVSRQHIVSKSFHRS